MNYREKYNAYQNEYQKARWQRRRLVAVDKLGGKCVLCGTTENLEFDHIDPSTKLNTIVRLSSASEEIFWAEISKCQLLCKSCHEHKTIYDLGQVSAKITHGTLSSYRYCKCDECREAKAKYYRENKHRWRKSKKLPHSGNAPDSPL